MYIFNKDFSGWYKWPWKIRSQKLRLLTEHFFVMAKTIKFEGVFSREKSLKVAYKLCILNVFIHESSFVKVTIDGKAQLVPTVCILEVPKRSRTRSRKIVDILEENGWMIVP